MSSPAHEYAARERAKREALRLERDEALEHGAEWFDSIAAATTYATVAETWKRRAEVLRGMMSDAD